MKEIKAFIHRSRIADVVHALREAGYRDLSVIDVKGMLKAVDPQEREFSLELGEKVITEVKLELVCDDDRADEAIRIIRTHGITTAPPSGWIYVIPIERAVVIGARQPSPHEKARRE